jgi:hypothetical protein
MPDRAPTEAELRETNAAIDEAARELVERFKSAPKPKNPGRWGCRQYVPTRRPDGGVDFILDRDAWEVHLLVESAIEEMPGEHAAGTK